MSISTEQANWHNTKKEPLNPPRFKGFHCISTGDPPGNRTPDTLLKRQVLYLLS